MQGFDCFGNDSSSSEEFSSESSPSNNNKKHHHRHRQQSLLADQHQRQLASDAAPFLKPISSPDFETFATRHAGVGLRALRQYSCGEEILREGAVMRVLNQRAATSRAEAEEMHRKDVHHSFHQLSSETQQHVLDLSNCHQAITADDENAPSASTCTKVSDVVGLYETNSFLLHDSNSNASLSTTASSKRDQNYGGLFLTIARINHSCRPNASHFWRPDLQQTLIFATRDIAVGEEICTTYGPSSPEDTAARRLYLQERFSFQCGCDFCQEGNADGGDDRMRELNSRLEGISVMLAATVADDSTGDTARAAAIQDILDSVEQCLVLLQQLKFHPAAGAFLKSILHYGYQASILLGAQQRCDRQEQQRGGEEEEPGHDNNVIARSYLERELKATMNGEGIDSPNALWLREMVDYMT